eukprot:CAMPEP_0170591232 /NCGR_PEP_ID=MMETSP0224-20130122/12293_1 /TAXON_ID=285029 /ORGANISM="Togula jolla, Strain CCCM 725" /LENGTH=1396 /DNA_ID=CAMNT_0010915081 /DNA_START=104 /DNA_END=4294 /DNA_ORIENTATION=-
MTSKWKASLDMMKEVDQGAKRTDQYVVTPHKKIIEEVSEEEHRQIMEKRRDDFIVEDSGLGYEDTGKEIWEEPDVDDGPRSTGRRSSKVTTPSKKAAAQAEVSPGKAPATGLLSAFRAGARTDGVEADTEPAVGTANLDGLLNQMLGQIASVGQGIRGTKRPQGSAPKVGRASKRRADGAGDVSKDVAMEASNVESVVLKVEPTDEPAVKVEPEEHRSNLKQELSDAVAVGTRGKKKAEMPSPNGGEQLREWLGDGSFDGVKQETEGVSGVKDLFKPILAESGALWFFFMDAFEDERAGRVYLFGKAQASAEASPDRTDYRSCCLVVENVERCLHLLLNADPDDEAAVARVAKEAEAELAERVPSLQKVRAKLKMRNYAFEKALPQGAGYLPFLKVVHTSPGQAVSPSLSGNSFSHVFGAQTSPLERLLLTRRIMGPSWLRLEPGSWTESPARLSYCAVELRITAASITMPKDEPLPDMPTASPPLRLLSVSMQTQQRSAQHGHEPVVIVCTLHPNVSSDASDSDHELKQGMVTWSAVRRFDARPLPRDSEKLLPNHNVEHFGSETALLEALLAKVNELDPDIIAGHNAYGFDLEVLASRISALKLTSSWQKLGRLRRSKERMPRVDGRQSGGFWLGSNLTAGRLVCDVMHQAKDLLPKLSMYDLPTLAREQLKVDSLQDVEPENLPQFYDTAQSLLKLTKQTFDKALCISRLMHSLQILPLTKQLTNLAGNLWNASLQNKRAERNEMLLCHEFHRKKFVLPDRGSGARRKRQAAGGGLDDAEEQDPQTSGPRRGKAAYSGGLVLEPKVGLYDDFVMLLDFNSLYPSIIQEHNICFTTVDRPDEDQVGQHSEADLLALSRLPDGTVREGILPQVLRRLVESRRAVKAAMKSERDKHRLQTLDIRQTALKLTANSMYGCLGFQNSRFYAKPLAALITAKGREALQSTCEIVQQELQLEVVYGDTDSVFVNSKSADYAQVLLTGANIKRAVNKRYKRLEIELDGVFARLLLLKKKKYAALKVVDWEKRQFEAELKGLDIVRRDWSRVAKDLGEAVLMKLLTGEGKEEMVEYIHQLMTEKGQEMDEGKVPLEMYIITKGLTKAPGDYPDAKNQPHVQVALRLMSRGKSVVAGQEMEYIITEASGDGKTSFADRARHPHDFQLDNTLKVDVAWYKTHQVHPLVSRLLAPVEGTDAARLAECLGMDVTRFAGIGSNKSHPGAADVLMEAADDVAALLDGKNRWKSYSSILPGMKCSACAKTLPWSSLLASTAAAGSEGGRFRCSECGSAVSPVQARNQVTLQIRALLKDYSEGWVQCQDDVCATKTRRVKTGTAMLGECHVLKELEYIEWLCQASGEVVVVEDSPLCREAVQGIQRTTRRLLQCHGYNWVDCGRIFGSIFG